MFPVQEISGGKWLVAENYRAWPERPISRHLRGPLSLSQGHLEGLSVS